MQMPTRIKSWLFWLIAVFWLATAIPITIFSMLVLELPFWPEFGQESTPEGVMIWAVFTAWFYITPVVLVIMVRRWRAMSTKSGGSA